MTTKPTLIGICGPARSGKDTCANALVEQLHFHRYSFADPLKRAAQEMFGLTDEQTWSDEYKDEVNPFWGITHREMFQKLGTEGGRQLFFTDIWVRRATLQLSRAIGFGYNRFVIPDIRFDNEADWLHDFGGTLFYVERPDLEHIKHSSHASENSLDMANVDEIILNDNTRYDLQNQIVAAVSDIIDSVLSDSLPLGT